MTSNAEQTLQKRIASLEKEVIAKNRALEIEAALERVRTKTIAMHNSDDVGDTVITLFDEVMKLGIDSSIRCGICILQKGKRMQTWSVTSDSNTKVNLKMGMLDMTAHPLLQGAKSALLNGDEKFTYSLSGKALTEYYKILNQDSEYPLYMDLESLPKNSNCATFNFKEGLLFAFTDSPLTAESDKILMKFTAVFGQTYRRYLDLLKAEAQAEEAMIEAALERVRAKAMAMHSSTDISAATIVVFNELGKLGIKFERCGILVYTESTTIEIWSTPLAPDDKEFVEVVTGNVDTNIHPLPRGIYRAWTNGEDFFSYELKGDEVKKYYDLLEKAPDYRFPKIEIYPVRQIINVFNFKEGGLFVYQTEPLYEGTKKILKRFTKVFSLTFRRYLDIIKAEAQAKEAVKQASLDRVRGEIASMRSAEDLQRITPLIFNELTTLGVPFFRCGVFIIHEQDKNVKAYLSAPDGHSLGVLNLAFNINTLTTNLVDCWNKEKLYHEHWGRADFIRWTKSMMQIGQVQNLKKYQGSQTPPDKLDLHFIPFTQGMLYVGNVERLKDEEIDLVKSLAEAFAMAYSRYDDFTQLEYAKLSIENTLNELKSTQKQLIQSEKMASLGELTAGIAHEIQNPLNFVNNFSEVSNEMLDEMKEELATGNQQEAMEIVEDIKQNLEKITHHGKRADSIVKGMLEHSRASTGTKEPTDINALADEYLRLAYHGLGAKDKSFNAEMKTDFDQDIGKIDVIPQDIGRVLLNLFNNAFYAVAERSRSAVNEKREEGKTDFKPMVSLSTTKVTSPFDSIVRMEGAGGAGRNAKNYIEIRVSDNGNGIPKKILDKIFQPFFTTKPTGQGTGLGLSLSYDIIKAHGGKLKVETEEGEGTEFTIILPNV